MRKDMFKTKIKIGKCRHDMQEKSYAYKSDHLFLEIAMEQTKNYDP